MIRLSSECVHLPGLLCGSWPPGSLPTPSLLLTFWPTPPVPPPDARPHLAFSTRSAPEEASDSGLSPRPRPRLPRPSLAASGVSKLAFPALLLRPFHPFSSLSLNIHLPAIRAGDPAGVLTLPLSPVLLLPRSAQHRRVLPQCRPGPRRHLPTAFGGLLPGQLRSVRA